MAEKGQTSMMPVLALRDSVMFPHTCMPLFIGRAKSIAAVEYAYNVGTELFIVAQSNPESDVVTVDELYRFGTVCNVSQVTNLTDGSVKVLVDGKCRGKTKNISEDEFMFQANVTCVPDGVAKNQHKCEALRRNILESFEQFIHLSHKISIDVLHSVSLCESFGKFADNIAVYIPLKVQEKQKILETLSVDKRLEILNETLEQQNELMKVERKIKTRVKRQVERNQKEYYLNEQLKAIYKELGNGDSAGELSELEEKVKQTKMSKEAMDKALSDIKKLRNIPPLSQEGGLIRTYIDTLMGLPWSYEKKPLVSLKNAEKILDASHYGLDKIKERIIEYLAVQQRVGKMKSQIMCFVGPPGVGKTSLGKAIAAATNKSFARIALGGISDEAEIRGHRRTYVGAMPGKIIQAMKKAGTTDPVIMLDEIDKMGSDWKGDPSSALLEVLDPEQNTAFVDNYIEVPYDLSSVMFITTANSTDIPTPLLDRMELINLSGYTEEEKLNIAKIHIIDKQKKENGLNDDELKITDDAVKAVIRNYTRESGVRNLERCVAKIARKSVKKILTSTSKHVNVTVKNLQDYLGVPRFQLSVEQDDSVGVVAGMAWTEMGGELLYVEALVLPGSGNIISTGQLGDVMQESIKAAYSYVKSKSTELKIDPKMFAKHDIHIHVPEGAVPKDGPSAGVTICTAIVSAVTKRPVRHEIAMTGEITLRGKVLGIGGLKEKLLAARRSGIKKVFIPEENKKDIANLPKTLVNNLDIQCATHVDVILQDVFVK